MSNLIRTPIVDKNGKQTTVHKRADQGAPSVSLAGLKPTLGGTRRSPKSTTKVKASAVKNIHERSILEAHPSYFEIEFIRYGRNEYSWRNEDMEIPTDRLYEYMRRGIDLTDASIFEGLGFTPEMVESEFPDDIPGRLSTLPIGRERFNQRYQKLENQNVINAMEEAGITPAKAFKVLENGLQDGHMGHLDIDQLVTLFGKWRYYGKQGTHPEQNTSRLIDKVVADIIPYELTLNTTRTELSRLENELRPLRANPLMERKNQDRELFIRVAEKAVKSIPVMEYAMEDTPVTKLYKMVDKHGEGVLDLPYPDLVTFMRHLGSKKQYDEDELDEETEHMWTPISLEQAKYAEAVASMGLEGRLRLWDTEAVSTDNQRGKHTPTLSHHDVLKLHEAGASVEQTHELLITRNLNIDQAMAVVKDGINSVIADGAL